MWIIDLLKLIYEATVAGKLKLLAYIVLTVGLVYGFWYLSDNIPNTVMFFVCLCLIYCVIELPSRIKEIFEIGRDINHDYRDKASPIVRYLLNKTILKLDADRAFVLEGHNGSSNLANLSFLYMDITYLETAIKND